MKFCDSEMEYSRSKVHRLELLKSKLYLDSLVYIEDK